MVMVLLVDRTGKHQPSLSAVCEERFDLQVKHGGPGRLLYVSPTLHIETMVELMLLYNCWEN